MNLTTFCNDVQGRTYTDVINDSRFDFEEILHFFNSQERIDRILVAQEHFKLPPLGGVAVEIEQHSAFKVLQESPRTCHRLKQAIGVIVRIIMEQNGWEKTAEDGSMLSITKLFKKAKLYRRNA
jgi:hypothetical protein